MLLVTHSKFSSISLLHVSAQLGHYQWAWNNAMRRTLLNHHVLIETCETPWHCSWNIETRNRLQSIKGFSPKNNIFCWFWDLGAFARLRKATINFVMPVRPSVRMGQLGSHWMDFREIWYLIVFRNKVEKIQV